MTDWEHEYRALREGLEALADEWSDDDLLHEFRQDHEAGIVWTPVGYFAPKLRALLAPSPAEGWDVPRANAWDEGFAKCSDWWHACAAGESHTVDTTNPYRAPSPAEGDGWPLDASVGPLGGVPMDTRPSPAEGTGEAIHDDGCAERCNHCEVCGISTPYGSRCPSHPNAPAPVSSGEAGGGIILLCGSTCGHDHNSLNGPTGCCEHGPYMYFCQQCHDAARPAPVVTPSAEDGAS